MSLSQPDIDKLLYSPRNRNYSERSPENIAWAGGLFEGEGSCSISNLNQARVELTSTDEDVVRKFAAIIGFGAVRKRVRPPYKDCWTWYVQDKYDVIESLELLLPMLGLRRTIKAVEVINRARMKRDYRKEKV